MYYQKLKIRYNEIPPIYAVLLATLYFLIGGIVISGAVQITCFSVLILLCIGVYKKQKISLIDMSWLISIVPFFYAVNEWNVSSLRDLIAYTAFVIFVVCVKTKPCNLDKAIKLIYYMAIIHLIFVFLNVVFKAQFTSFIYSMLDSGALPTYNRALSRNLYTGFGYIPGDTSGYLVDGILVLLFFNKQLIQRKKHITVILLLIGILFCAKRSHLLCLLLAAMITWTITANGTKKVKRITISLIGIASLFTVGYTLLPFFSGIPMVSRLTVLFDQIAIGADYTSNRSNLSSLAMQFFNENRAFGVGWKFFNHYTYDQWDHTNYVNNVYLQLLSETGVVGFVLFVTPMAASLTKTIRAVRELKEGQLVDTDYGVGNYLSLALSIQLFFLLYCFFEIPFYDYTFLFIYAVAIAISNCVVLVKKTETFVFQPT